MKMGRNEIKLNCGLKWWWFFIIHIHSTVVFFLPPCKESEKGISDFDLIKK